jgi:hypothetical protein
LDEQPDDEGDSDEFEGAPEIETHEVDLDFDAEDVEVSRFADEAE